MADEYNSGESRRTFLKGATLGGIGLLGVGTGSAGATSAMQVRVADVGVEHDVHFASLPASRYRTREELLAAAIADTDLDRADLAALSEAERRAVLSFPGDRGRLVDPARSGVNVDVKPDPLDLTGNSVRIPASAYDVLGTVLTNDVVLRQASEGLGGSHDISHRVLVTGLAGVSQPRRGYSLAPDAEYRLPEIELASVGSDGLDVRTETGIEHVGTGDRTRVEQPRRTVELQLRTYDGSLTTESVPVTPTLVVQNHGDLAVETVGWGR